MKNIFKTSFNKERKQIFKHKFHLQEVGKEQDENIKETTPFPSTKLNKKLLQILAIIVATVFLVVIWSAFSAEGLHIAFFSNNFTENIQGSNVEKRNFQLMDGKIAAVSDTSFTINKKSGKQINNTLHSFNQPAMDTDGNYAIIYNIDGKGFQIEKNSSQIINSNTSNEIICAAVSKSGVYALVTKSNDYVAELTVYSADFNEKYKYYFAENYVTDIAINKEGTRAIVSALQSDNGTLKSVIYILDFTNEQALVKLDANDNMVLYVDYFYDGNPVAIGDRYLSIINISKANKSDFNYNDKMLVSYSVNPKLGVSLALSSSNDGRNCDCVVIDSKLNKKADFSTEISVLSISSQNNRIAILSDGLVYIYKFDASNTKKIEVMTDSSKILLTSNNSFYLLGENEIRGISF